MSLAPPPAWPLAAALALPWALGLAMVLWRLRDSRSLDEFAPLRVEDAPSLSVIVPARDERHNIGRCVASILASGYPRLELLVVDDHSTDGTAEVARAAAAGDPRLRVVPNPDLPAGWFGKQWACATGAARASGSLLLFTDADAWHGPELHARAVSALLARDLDLLTLTGRQELRSFWEKVAQPQPLAVILARYGGTERVNRSTRVSDKVASGLFLLARREAYDALGGHAAVRDRAAEDQALAQRFFERGRRTAMLLAEHHLAVRMYTSLGELVRGWGKNVYAAGRDAMRGGRVGRMLFPLLLPLPALLQLLPVLALLLGIAGAVPPAVGVWGALACIPSLAFWAYTYARAGERPWWALLFPLGAAVYLWIALTATARGRRVRWKGRDYRAG